MMDGTFFASYADAVTAYVASTSWLQEWPECRHLLLKHLSVERQEPWVLVLPGICCLAVGGTPTDAIPVAAAATMLMQAAHIFDAVQDGDDIAPSELPTSATATSLATGLIFAAFRFLGSVQAYPGAERRLSTLFSEAAFHSSLGQYLDLTQDYGDLSTIDALEAYWRMVIAKSGSLIRLATAGGAAAGTDSEDLIAALGEFGQCLGVILQVLDDCRDVLVNSNAGGCEISLPLLLLSMANEKGCREAQEDFPFPKETLFNALREAGVPEVISDVLLEWQRRALDSLAPLGSSEAVATLKSILDRVLTPSPLLDSNGGRVGL
jgi:geranylgeranyl pyrophosphate synthase